MPGHLSSSAAHSTPQHLPCPWGNAAGELQILRNSSGTACQPQESRSSPAKPLSPAQQGKMCRDLGSLPLFHFGSTRSPKDTGMQRGCIPTSFWSWGGETNFPLLEWLELRIMYVWDACCNSSKRKEQKSLFVPSPSGEVMGKTERTR